MEAVNMGVSGINFHPKHNTGLKSGFGLLKPPTGVTDELCSTAAPSPAFTSKSFGPSPAVSPKEGFASSTWQLDQFVLPDAFETEHSALKDSTFVLTGLEDLQNSLAGLLARLPAAAPEEAKAGQALTPPPGLEPLAGLVPPPGLGHIERQEPEAEQTPKKENPLPAECMTAMLRNIPNKYTQDMLIERLHKDGYQGDLDFIYLPIDFKNQCNFGYGFVNFRTPEACARFAEEYHQMESQVKLPGFRSRKVIEVSPARHQGLEENVARLQHSPVLAKLVGFGKQEWLPKLLGKQGEVVEVLHPSRTPAALKRGSGRPQC